MGSNIQIWDHGIFLPKNNKKGKIAMEATSILKSTAIELVEASAALRRRALDSPEISGLA
jgi:hypothetical protein